MKDSELASILGMRSQSEITAYKSRAIPPHATHVLLIAQQCGVDPGWLAFGQDSKAPAPDGFEKWLRNKTEEAEHAFGDGAEIPTLERESFDEEEPSTRATGTLGRPRGKKRR
jgi:transcriptional regulator with XRE-family HTH domain